MLPEQAWCKFEVCVAVMRWVGFYYMLFQFKDSNRYDRYGVGLLRCGMVQWQTGKRWVV
jgi:hypothetical protein